MRWFVPIWLALCLPATCIPAVAQTPATQAPGTQPPGTQTPGATQAAPAAPAAGDDRQALIDRMLDALKTAPDEAMAAPLEAQITDLMLQQGTPAVTLLVARGVRELNSHAPQDAVEDLDAAITLDPDLAEAYHQRAIARFAAGDAPGAIADLQQTLQRQPRDFGAFRTLAAIAESRQDWKSAYAAWQKLMVLDPMTPGAADRLKDLRRRALGEET
jgi:tetratricopeptide (TPR) repeat protein